MHHAGYWSTYAKYAPADCGISQIFAGRRQVVLYSIVSRIRGTGLFTRSFRGRRQLAR